jgi:acetyltransferase-like isoleucine patch superfamily enzyme
MIINTKIGERTKIWYPELVNIYESTIGADCKIASFVEIGKSIIGDKCKIEAFSFIPPGIVIGNEVFIGPHVVFTNDKYPKSVGEWNLLETIVEDGVSIGAGSIILPGIKIGNNSIIAAGSLIVKDVPANVTVMGSYAGIYKRKNY